MNKEKITELYLKFELTKDDIFKHKHYLIITRSGVEKIQSKSNIEVNFNLEQCTPNFSVVKATAFKREAADVRIETYGSALKGSTYSEGSTNSWYVTELAEKRALSRAILKLVGAYELGILAKMSQKTSNANNMQGSKEYFLRVKEEEYFDLPQALRERCTVYYNDYELYKDNPSFKALNKAYRNSKKALENWKYDQRHN